MHCLIPIIYKMGYECPPQSCFENKIGNGMGGGVYSKCSVRAASLCS